MNKLAMIPLLASLLMSCEFMQDVAGMDWAGDESYDQMMMPENTPVDELDCDDNLCSPKQEKAWEELNYGDD